MSRQEHLHAAGEVSARCFEQEIKVIALDDEAQQLPVRTGDSPCEVVDQALPVLPIVNDVLQGITPRHDVVDGAVKFDAKSSWQSRTLVGAVPVQGKTKNRV
jgi:hypothetical protein